MAAYGDLDKEFDPARARARRQAGADIQQKRDVLARRQAQLGGGPGGAFIKAEQGAIEGSQAQLAQADEGINAAQTAELRRMREVEGAQAFQRGEREATLAFQQKQLDTTMGLEREKFGESQRQFSEQLKFNKSQSDRAGSQWDKTFAQSQKKIAFDQDLANREFAATMADNFLTQVGNMWANRIPREQIDTLMRDVGIIKDKSGKWVIQTPDTLFGDPHTRSTVEGGAGTSKKQLESPNWFTAGIQRQGFRDEQGRRYTLNKDGTRSYIDRE
jgi:hypothetical protein